MKALKKLRQEMGMTQANLAQKMGVTQSMVAKWEAGSSCPRGEVLVRLASLLHCTIDELFGREPGAPAAGGQDSVRWNERG